jgi:hypothetical protein
MAGTGRGTIRGTSLANKKNKKRFDIFVPREYFSYLFAPIGGLEWIPIKRPMKRPTEN